MKNLTEKIILKLSCGTFMQKECIAALLCEHLDEFENVYFEDVMENYLDKIIKKGEEGCAKNYDFCVVAHSPNISKKHKIVVAVQLKMHPPKEDEMVPSELEEAFEMYHEEKMKVDDDTILRCYGFCFYLDPPKELQDRTIRLKMNICTADGNNLMGENRCNAFIVYLGDQPKEEVLSKIH